MRVNVKLKNESKILKKVERAQELLNELRDLVYDLHWLGIEFETVDEAGAENE